jgi:glutathione synthase/RimK-type ligase-like ATP-grasp enzyme
LNLSDHLVFLWGHASDTSLLAVNESLRKLNASVAFYDQRRVLETEFQMTVDSEVSGQLRVEDEEIDLEQISAAYIRPFDSRWLPQIERAGPNTPEWIHAAKIEDALISWAEIAPAFIINRPKIIASNSSKPYQAERIRDLGFLIPETLVTTDEQAVKEFWEKHGTLIYKSVSATRSVVSRLSREQLSDLQNISWCPTQFQEYIAGNDYRVHVVGEEVFACEIVCDADDYRFAYAQKDNVELRAFNLPDDVSQRCLNLAAGLGMAVAGIDLRCTPEGKWYCFEVNPVAGFAYYQEPCNHHIDDAIARLLMSNI